MANAGSDKEPSLVDNHILIPLVSISGLSTRTPSSEVNTPDVDNSAHSVTDSSNVMAPTNSAKSASVADEKKKLLQQYKNDEGHFSLVRCVWPSLIRV